ncbi:MAG: MFS transporter [Alphaproteobacteria bacterium]|nr:MFS transporter [Alphaproteobacteria bacterium]
MALRISLFYSAIFLVIGVLMPFWPVWLQSRGITATEIGVILAVATWSRAIINPLLAQGADRHGRPDLMIVLLGWGALLTHILFFFSDGFWSLFAISVISSTLLFALMPMADAVTMLKVREGAIDYGKVRLWGSLTFIVAAFGGGFILRGQPADYILWLVVGLLVLTVTSCHLVPRAETPGTKNFLEPFFNILRNKRLIIFMMSASLIQASHAVYYGFSTLHWQANGLDEITIGALWAEGVIAEIILFAVAGKYINRIGPVLFLTIGGIAGIIRWSVLGVTTDLAGLIAVQGFHAFTFGATHLAALYYIAKAVPAGFAATAQSLYSSFAVGTTMAFAMLASGWLYELYAGAAFFAMAAMSIGGILLLIPVRFIAEKPA